MSNHPNRNNSSAARNPSPEEIKALREKLGLTQTEASVIIYSSCRAWQQWEAGDRRLHPAFWELFKLKALA